MRLLLVILLTCSFSGCVATGSLKRDLYPRAAAAPISTAKVVVVSEPGSARKLHHREMPWTSVDIDLSGYPQAAAAMLSSLYAQVSVTTNSAQAPAADFIARLSPDYPRTIGLTIQDSAGRTLGSFSRPGVEIRDAPDADSKIAKIMTPPALIVSVGTLGIAFAYRAIKARDAIALEISTTTARALEDVRAQIAATPSLLPAAASAPWTSSPTCTAALSDAQAPADIHLSCAQAAENGRAWRQAAAHLKAYLAARSDAPDAAELRRRLSELETRP